MVNLIANQSGDSGPGPAQVGLPAHSRGGSPRSIPARDCFVSVWEKAEMDACSGDTLLGVPDFCEQVKELCEQGELDIAEVLTALTLAIRDLALHHHGSDRARQQTVLALDKAFELTAADMLSYPHGP